MEATANGALSVRGLEFVYRGSLTRDAKRTQRFARFFKIASKSEGMPGLGLENPAISPIRPLNAPWLPVVERRIELSVSTDSNAANDNRWLTQVTAIAAIEFFKATSDLLPGEPYIYGSQKGDLVAEFKGAHGTLTSIISPAFSLLFAVVDGNTVEKTVLGESGVDALRSELRRLAELLRTGWHGSLATGN